MAETIRGGGSVGPSKYFGYHGSWPFASLTVDSDAVTFKLFPLTYRIEKQYIKHLVQDKVLWSSFLRIVHVKTELAKWICFAPWSMSDLAQILSRYNYQIESSDAVQDTEDSTLEYTNPLVVKVGVYVCLIATVAGLLAALWATHRSG